MGVGVGVGAVVTCCLLAPVFADVVWCVARWPCSFWGGHSRVSALAGGRHSSALPLRSLRPGPTAPPRPALRTARRMAVSPDDLPDTVFASIGRLVWRDIGATALGFRLLMKVGGRLQPGLC